jgi:hypothetical protein
LETFEIPESKEKRNKKEHKYKNEIILYQSDCLSCQVANICLLCGQHHDPSENHE